MLDWISHKVIPNENDPNWVKILELLKFTSEIYNYKLFSSDPLNTVWNTIEQNFDHILLK